MTPCSLVNVFRRFWSIVQPYQPYVARKCWQINPKNGSSVFLQNFSNYQTTQCQNTPMWFLARLQISRLKKKILKTYNILGRGLELIGSEWGPEAGCCEHGDEHPGCMKYGEFLGYMKIYYLLKGDPPPRSYSKFWACLCVELTQTLTWTFSHLSLVSFLYLLVFCLLRSSTCLWSPPFIYFYLVSSFYLLILDLLLFTTCLWSPPCIYLCLVSFFYLLVFGLLHLFTCVWSPPFIYLFLVFFLHLLIFGIFFCLLVLGLLLSIFISSLPFIYLCLVSSFYLTCFWYPTIIYISFVSLFYLLVFGLLSVFDILPLYNYLWSPFSTCF
jgi:hypothetical protein